VKEGRVDILPFERREVNSEKAEGVEKEGAKKDVRASGEMVLEADDEEVWLAEDEDNGEARVRSRKDVRVWRTVSFA
jgi:hypothetical protein